MTYAPPLRCAILYLVETATHWDELSVAMIAHTRLHNARVYCQQLVDDRVLVRAMECLHPGPQFDRWHARRTRARPGHTSDYNHERRLRTEEEGRQRLIRSALSARLRALRTERSIGIRSLCREAHIGVRNLRNYEAGKWMPSPEVLERIGAVLGVASWV